MKKELFRPFIFAFAVFILAFIVFLACQAVACRLKIFSYMGINLFILSIVISILTMLVAPRFFSRLLPESKERYLISVLVALAFLGYANLYSIVFPVSLERSFSVRILVNLSQAPDQSLEKALLENLHTREQIYGLRFREMDGVGLIKIEGDKVMLQPRGLLMARAYLLVWRSMGYPGDFDGNFKEH